MSLTPYPTLRLKLTMPQALKLQFLPAVPGFNAAGTAAALENKVNRTGDTMTGFLTLSGAPTQALHAATKQYVDSSIGGGGVTNGDKGDITVSGSGLVWVINPNIVTYAKIQDVSASPRIMGRFSAGAGDMQEGTSAQVTAVLDQFTSTLKGVAPASGGGNANFLRADGSWAVPGGVGGGDVFAAGNNAFTGQNTFNNATLYAAFGATGLIETYRFAIHQTNAAIYTWDSSATFNGLHFNKSRGGGVPGVNGAVLSTDFLGQLNFRGNDGTGFFPAAQIVCGVDGTIAAGQVPGRFQFNTRPVGGGSMLQRVSVNSSGLVEIGQGTPAQLANAGTQLLQVDATDGTAGASVTRWSNDAIGPTLSLRKQRGATIGSYTDVSSQDVLGNIDFMAGWPSGFGVGARLRAVAETGVFGAPLNAVSRFEFWTSANPPGTPISEKMRLWPSGGLDLVPGLGLDPGGGAIRSTTAVPAENSTIVATTAFVQALVGSSIKTIAVQKFTASGTYTPTAGMKFCIAEVVAGGGGGGGVNASGVGGQYFGAGGGGSGGYSRARLTAAQIGASQAVTIGAGGGGAAAGPNNGSNGGDTSLGALCIGRGGSGGKYIIWNGISIGEGGAGGVPGTGDVTSAGMPGDCGFFSTSSSGSTLATSGAGGSSFFGGGASGVYITSAATNGANASNYGGGGSGGMSANNTSNCGGGNGSSGFVIVTEFI